MLINTGIFLLTGAAISILIWVGICVLTILYKSNKAKRHDQRYTPGETIVGFAVTGVLGQVLYWVAACLILKGAAAATVMLADNNAAKIYEAVETYAEKHPEVSLHSVSGSSAQIHEYAYDSLEAEIIREFPYEHNFWFSVSITGEGEVQAVYFTHHAPKKGELRASRSKDQVKIALNPFLGADYVVGSYTITDARRSSPFDMGEEMPAT